MHLVELTDRSSSIVMVQRARKNGHPFSGRFRRGASYDQIAVAFEAYGQLGRVSIRHSTAISALSTMHEDICHVAEYKRVGMIILPFHKQRRGEGEEEMENVGHGWREVNQRLLKSAPCSAAVLVDRGFGVGSEQVTELTDTMPRRVCIVFFGGPDDREALELGGRMGEHPAVKVTLIRFFEKAGEQRNSIAEWASMNHQREKELDDAAAAEFKRRWSGSVGYEEKVVNNIAEGVLAIGQSREYELLIVGKGQFQSTRVARSVDQQAEHAELGPIGDILASSDHSILSSVLVIQQHNIDNANMAA